MYIRDIDSSPTYYEGFAPMPTRPNSEKRSADAIACAVTVGKTATLKLKDTRHAQPRKAITGRKGGEAHSNCLPPERRSEIGRMAAQVRWAKNSDTS